MANELRLNLGSGCAYKSGYVNVDISAGAVVDKVADASDLPYEPDTVDAIEANQLVEHFDLVHCRYLLAEWFRVLKPEGSLTIETPDIRRSLKKLMSSREKSKESTLQWIFGIDSPGLVHKTGFTYEVIKSLLCDTGFENVREGRPQTHEYEPGMRVTCRKPRECAEAQFFACFRKRAKRLLETDDSFVLIPLEGWIRKGMSVPLKRLDRSRLNELLSSLAPCHPSLALAFLEECQATGHLKKPHSSSQADFLEYLQEMRFHERGFELWTRSRKSPSLESDFENFMGRLKTSVRSGLEDPGAGRDKLEYVQSLPPRAIPVLDLALVVYEAQRLLSIGVKEFSGGNLTQARDIFAESVRVNPRNPLAQWNLARVTIALNGDSNQIEECYRSALDSASSGNLKRVLSRERDAIHRSGTGERYSGPVRGINSLEDRP